MSFSNQSRAHGSQSGSNIPYSGEGKAKVYLGEYHGRRTYDGFRHGYAWTILPNSDMYVGNYVNGMRQGKGLYVFKNGSRYNGDWKNNLKHGVGKMIYPDGTFYEGEWKRNFRHGLGTYTYSNGDYYKGSWKSGKWHGLGVYTFLQSTVSVKAIWNNGIQDGPGKILYPFFTFCGTWVDGVNDGKGLYSFYNKCIQEGIFVVIKKDESQKTITTSENQSQQSQYAAPEIVPAEQEEEEAEVSKTSSQLTQEESKASIHVEWIPLRINRFDVKALPPEPTCDEETISISEQTLVVSQETTSGSNDGSLENEQHPSGEDLNNNTSSKTNSKASNSHASKTSHNNKTSHKQS